MSVTLVRELVSAKEAWDHIFKDVDPGSRSSDEADALARLINGVSAALDTLYGPLRATTVTETFDPQDSEYLFLRKRPIISVGQVNDGNHVLTEGVDFYTYKDQGYLRRYPFGRWVSVSTFWAWGTVTPQSISVTYTAGRCADNVTAVPGDIKMAALLWIQELWTTGPANLTNLITSTGMMLRPTGVPPQVTEIMARYTPLQYMGGV